MNSDVRERLGRLLIERRDDLRRRLGACLEDLAGLAGSRGAATADDEHDPEGATLAVEWSRLEGLRGELERELRAVGTAIERADTDATFGVCEGCGADIPDERLLVRPEAARCVACASQRR